MTSSIGDRPDLRPPDGGKSLHLDRLTFLRKVEEVAQDCLRDLYERATRGQDEEASLEAWGEEFYLQDPWITETARATFRVYADPTRHQEWREQQARVYEMNRELIDRGEVSMELRFDLDDLTPPYEVLTFCGGLQEDLRDLTLEAIRDFPLLPTPKPSLELPSYNPTYHSAAEYREQVLGALAEHVEEEQSRARQDGAEPVRRKRARVGSDPDLELDWLARWQVAGEMQQELRTVTGDHPKVPVKTVQRAIRRAAKRIGLTRKSQL